MWFKKMITSYKTEKIASIRLILTLQQMDHLWIAIIAVLKIVFDPQYTLTYLTRVS